MQQTRLYLNPTRTAPRQTACAIAIAIALLVSLLGWAPAPPAVAHDDLDSSDPAEASVVEVLPSRAVLVLSGEIRKVREITVTGPEGDVANGRPTFSGAEVRQNLWSGPDGDYVVAYNIVSSDGHEVTGEVHFEVGQIAGPSNNGSPDAVTATSGSGLWDGGRGTILLAMLLLAGAGGLVVLRGKRLGRRF